MTGSVEYAEVTGGAGESSVYGRPHDHKGRQKTLVLLCQSLYSRMKSIKSRLCCVFVTKRNFEKPQDVFVCGNAVDNQKASVP